MEKDSQIFKIRHSLAHVLAEAVLELYPHAKCGSGPATETGFFYGFDFSGGDAPGEEDLKAIEKKMRHLLKQNQKPEQETISKEEALERFGNSPYKTEIINEKGESGDISVYTIGKFSDPCSGPHVEQTKDIPKDAFQLERVAGAYWKGDESNPMLTRIYGLAFESKEALDEHLAQVEEAKKRDHRKIGKEMDLFTFSDLVGSGLPLWTPKGALLRRTLDEYIWKLRESNDYTQVTIPHITKKDLYEKSGHWEKFADELFRITTREGKEYALKPMNCPHHTQIFSRQPHSYRDMPQRYAETTMVYRDEQSGELGGLTRVLSITQDDAHVFCRKSQVKEEFFKVWDMIDTFYGAFGFELHTSLSFHDPAQADKYLGDASVWEEAENALREIAKERNVECKEAQGEAALYGPKIDFLAKDSLGRKHQVATIQLDMNLPERFDLTCINENGEKERIVMIHCAIMGSLERFSAVLIEHLGGNFPLWLAPDQIRVIPVADTHVDYAREIHEKLHGIDIRASIDDSKESMGKKIRNAKQERLPYFIVVGDKEMADDTVTLESRNGDSQTMTLEELGNHLLAEIDTKKM